LRPDEDKARRPIAIAGTMMMASTLSGRDSPRETGYRAMPAATPRLGVGDGLLGGLVEGVGVGLGLVAGEGATAAGVGLGAGLGGGPDRTCGGGGSTPVYEASATDCTARSWADRSPCAVMARLQAPFPLAVT
jgi:hypothetical protein